MDTVNYRDIAFKVMWTGVSAVLAALVVLVADIPAWWSAPATMIINAALAWVRQRTGETPPDISSVRRLRSS